MSDWPICTQVHEGIARAVFLKGTCCRIAWTQLSVSPGQWLQLPKYLPKARILLSFTPSSVKYLFCMQYVDWVKLETSCILEQINTSYWITVFSDLWNFEHSRNFIADVSSLFWILDISEIVFSFGALEKRLCNLSKLVQKKYTWTFSCGFISPKFNSEYWVQTNQKCKGELHPYHWILSGEGFSSLSHNQHNNE